MGVKIFTSDFIRNQLPETELKALIKAFRAYQDSGDVGDMFGPDYPYVKPPSVVSAGLQHVHVPDSTARPFSIRMAQFKRRSDTALVYCTGFFKEDHVFLIGILHKAHDAYQHRPHSWYVPFVKMAEYFREKY